jgi:DNA-directed RNA polymerase subunit RPC12/RpoP
MEATQKEISKNEAKNVALIGRCGRCKREFSAEAELPLIVFEDEEGNIYKELVSAHFVVNCPYCFGLLNLALRTNTNKQRG